VDWAERLRRTDHRGCLPGARSGPSWSCWGMASGRSTTTAWAVAAL